MSLIVTFILRWLMIDIYIIFSAEPTYLNITLPDGQDVLHSSTSVSTVGPFNEGTELRLLCESGGGKPIPRVTWYNGSQIISGKWIQNDDFDSGFIVSCILDKETLVKAKFSGNNSEKKSKTL